VTELHDLDNREHVTRAFRFSAMNQVATRILTFVSGIVVMRILSPSEVGTFAGATAIVVFCTACNDLAMSPTIIQWKGKLSHATSTAWTVSIVGSSILYGVIFLLAPTFANMMDNHQIVAVLRILAVAIIIDGFGSVPLAVLTRHMRQKTLLYIESFSLIIQIVITVTLAAMNFGTYALVWSMLVSNALTVVLMIFLVENIGRPGMDKNILKQLTKFGGPIAGANILREVTTNFDNVVVGTTQGTRQLGFYQLGYNGGNLPENTIGATVGRVAFAWFAQLTADTKRRSQAFHDLTLAIMAITLPFVVFLVTLADKFVITLYGDKWEPAINIVRLLAILGGMRVFMNFFADVFGANGEPLLELKTFALWAIAIVPALIIGAKVDGITGVAAAHILVAALVVAPLVIKNLAVHGFSFKGVLRHSIPLFIGAIFQAIVCIVIDQQVGSGLVTMVVAGVAGSAAYIACTYRTLLTIKKSFSKDVAAVNSADDSEIVSS
jgi:PST family polysaccharide transporter